MEANYFTILYWFCHTSTAHLTQYCKSSTILKNSITLEIDQITRYYFSIIHTVMERMQHREVTVCRTVVSVYGCMLSHVRLLCDPMNCRLPNSFVPRIFQARILERVAISSSRGSSWPKDHTLVSCVAGRFFTCLATGESPGKCMCIPTIFVAFVFLHI